MRLQEFRKLRKMSRPAFAREIGVRDVTVWRWEAGRCVPQLAQLQLIKKITDGAVTGSDFLQTRDEAEVDKIAQ